MAGPSSLANPNSKTRPWPDLKRLVNKCTFTAYIKNVFFFLNKKVWYFYDSPLELFFFYSLAKKMTSLQLKKAFTIVFKKKFSNNQTFTFHHKQKLTQYGPRPKRKSLNYNTLKRKHKRKSSQFWQRFLTYDTKSTW